MTVAIIITLCILLLIAYLFDLTSARTRIPSVILLLFLGWGARQLSGLLKVQIPDLSTLLPIFGTIGLILIVLEGALELELNKSKAGLVGKSFLVAFAPMLILAFLMAFTFQQYSGGTFKINLLNAVPLCVISSAIAIPSAKNLSPSNREFVIYETSLSDILGVLLFNFVLMNDGLSAYSFGNFGLQLLIIFVISFAATVGLAFLLKRIDHHIKFAPIILLVILIYEVSKIYHLPGLVFILFFGLFLGNLDELKRFKWIRKLDPEGMDREIHKFKDLTIEATFLVRSVFFILFGYLIKTSEIQNTDTLLWAIGITASIFCIRGLILAVAKIPLFPLLWIAPRGLITILLFFAIEPAYQLPLVNRSLIIQVIILTAFTMMLGIMFGKTKGPRIIDSPIDGTDDGSKPNVQGTA